MDALEFMRRVRSIPHPDIAITLAPDVRPSLGEMTMLVVWRDGFAELPIAPDESAASVCRRINDVLGADKREEATPRAYVARSVASER